MSRTSTLNDVSGVVFLDGFGNGIVSVGPQSAREEWIVDKASVRVSFPGVQTQPTNEATCSIYVGTDTSQTNFRDATFTGSSGDSTDAVSGRVKVGSYVWAVWTGGDAGQQATLSLSGTRIV